ncbi:MAG: LamG-like jellyroll fold domain-containing protein [Patescibacteria group bacterium]|jgi:hypothetical protein
MDHTITTWLAQARSAGLTNEQISSELRKSGWKDTDIAELLNTNSAPDTKVSKGNYNIAEHALQTHQSRRFNLKMSIPIVAILLVLGSGAYAYSQGMISLPFVRTNGEEKILKALEQLTDKNGGEFGVTFRLAGEQRSQDVRPIDFEKITGESTSQTKADDAETRSHAMQIRTGLVLYYDDHAAYPATLTELTSNYLVSLPAQSDGSDFLYSASADNTHYSVRYTVGSPSIEEEITDSGTLPYADIADEAESSPLSDIFGAYTDEYAFDFLPSDIDVQGKISLFTSTKNQSSEDVKSILTVQGSYSSGGTTMSVDGEARRLDNKYYLQIRQFPALFFFDVSAFKDKWIVIDPETDENILGFIDLSDVTEAIPEKEKTDKLRSEISHVLNIAFQEKALTAELDRKEEINGKKTQKIKFTIVPDKLPGFVSAYRTDAANRGVDISGAEELLKTLTNPEFIEQASALLKNSTFSAWVDVNSSTPRKLELSIVLVPPDSAEKLKDRQFRLTLGFTFDHLGEEPSVKVPEDTISTDEMQRLMSGQSVEEFNVSKQISSITDIRSAIARYKDVNDSYPDTLDALLEEPPKTDDSSELSYELQSSGYFYSLKKVPTDVYTNQPFEYTKNDTGYQLIYTIHFPPEQSESSDSPLTGMSEYYRSQYREGQNTATETFVSVETAKTEDADKDGLSDYDESVHKTSNYNKDTDGDGVNDGDEVKAGTDPIQEKQPGGVVITPIPTEVDTYAPTTTPIAVTSSDEDTDGLFDYMEWLYGTSPTTADTDGDGYTDGEEVVTGNTPFSSASEKRLTSVTTAGPLSETQGTISFWTQDADWEDSSYHNLISIVSEAGQEAVLIRKGAQYVGIIFDDSPVTAWSTVAPFTPDVWHHVVITWEVEKVPELYFDGELLTEYIGTQGSTTLKEAEAQLLNQKLFILTGFRFQKYSDGGASVEDYQQIEEHVDSTWVESAYAEGKS